MSPIGRMALDLEGVRMHELYRACRPVLTRSPRQKYEIIGAEVDCLYTNCPTKVARDLQRAVEKLTYEDGTRKFHWSTEGTPDYPVATEWPVVEQARPEVEVDPWCEYLEDGDPVELIRQIVVEQGRSLFVAGAPGVGKSFAVRAVVKELRERGKEVRVMAPANSAARVHGEIGGTTIHHFRRKHPVFKGFIVIDEATLVSTTLFAALQKYLLAGCKFIVMGDFTCQLGAAHNRWRNCPADSDRMEDSEALKALCDGNRVTLTQCRRSGPELFSVYAALPKMTTEDAIARLRERFPLTGQAPDWELTMSHAHRIRLCVARNRRDLAHAPPERLVVPADKQKDGVEIVLFRGVHLVGQKTRHGRTPIYAGTLYQVVDVKPPVAFIRELGSDGKETGPVITVGLDEMRNLRLAGALVYYLVQGLTLHGRVRLHLNSDKLTVRHLVVGVSRATDVSLVECA